MTDHTNQDHARLNGAKAALSEAVGLLGEAIDHGQCPLSASNVRDAEKLAAGATVLIEYVTGKGDW